MGLPDFLFHVTRTIAFGRDDRVGLVTVGGVFPVLLVHFLLFGARARFRFYFQVLVTITDITGNGLRHITFIGEYPVLLIQFLLIRARAAVADLDL